MAAAAIGKPRVNIRTILPLPPVRIGINKDQPVYVQSLRGIGRDAREVHDQIMKILPKRIDSNSELCFGLSKPYSKRSVESSSLIFAMEGDIYTVGIYGFATVKMYKLGAEQNKYFEIDVFCTKQSYKGIGKRIMDEIKTIATNVDNSITSIVLKSTPDAMPFYLSQGFRVYDAAQGRSGLTRMYLNIDGSDEESWKIVPGFGGDRIVPADAEAAPLYLSASEAVKETVGGARRTRKKRITTRKRK